MPPFERACHLLGGYAGVARALGTTRSSVHAWRARRVVPRQWLHKLEEATGRQVLVSELDEWMQGADDSEEIARACIAYHTRALKALQSRIDFARQAEAA